MKAGVIPHQWCDAPSCPFVLCLCSPWVSGPGSRWGPRASPLPWRPKRHLPFPVDTTRVILRDVEDSAPGADYINANYIRVSVHEVWVASCTRGPAWIKHQSPHPP